MAESIADLIKNGIVATLFVVAMTASGSAQDALNPAGKVVSRTPLVVRHHLDGFRYHEKSDAWFGPEFNPSFTHNRDQPNAGNTSAALPQFDSERWKLHSQSPICSLLDAAELKARDAFVSVQQRSAASREPQIYVRLQGEDSFQFVCRGTSPCPGSQPGQKSGVTFCYLHGSLASVWNNGASRVLDADVDSITWTRDRRHIVYARRDGNGHQLIAYSIADDDYSVLVALPNSPQRPLLFPFGFNGVYLVTTGTELRTLSLPLASTSPSFKSLKQVPLLYHSTNREIVAVSDWAITDDQQADSKRIRMIEQASGSDAQFEVRIAVP